MLEKAMTAARQTEAIKKQQGVVRGDQKLPLVDTVNSQKPKYEQCKSHSKIPQLLQNKATNKLAQGVVKHLPMETSMPSYVCYVSKKDTISQCVGQRKQL